MRRKVLTLLALLLATGAMAQNSEVAELSKRVELQQKQIEALEASVKKSSWTNKLKLSGYIQTQWQMASQDGQVADNSNNSLNIRRARLKAAYKTDYFSTALQINAGESGVSLVEAAMNFHLPNQIFEANLGQIYLPFSYYLDYSSSARMEPEYPALLQALMPSDLGLGAQIKLRGEKGSELNKLNLALGLYSMNGTKSDINSRKRFLSRLQYNTTLDNGLEWGLMASFQSGGVLNYETVSFTYQKDLGYESENKQGEYSASTYYDLGAKLSFDSPLGRTDFKGEYLFGVQVGTESSNKTQKNEEAISTLGSLYSRNFSGFYVTLNHKFASTNLSFLLRYDTYDPNSKVTAQQIGVLRGTGAADVAKSTLGTGVAYDFLKGALRVVAYYELNMNEKTPNYALFANNLADNLFTLRLQAKF